MIERLAADANAVIDLLRTDRADPPPLRNARRVLLPLPVVGELFAGAHHSDRVEENLAQVERLLDMWTVLEPDIETARVYGRIRGSVARLSIARINDLWIAALCIQHDLPLLSNDRGFDVIPNLITIRW